jgi:hypothetical protein
MERAHLVRLERADDRVQHATIMEQDQVLFFFSRAGTPTRESLVSEIGRGMKSEKNI